MFFFVHFVLICQVCDKWSGFALASDGVYHFTPTGLAAAGQAIGFSRGAALVSNLRFTYVDAGQRAEVLPSTRWGVSAAGMEHQGRGRYTKYGATLPVDTAFVVTVAGLGTPHAALTVQSTTGGSFRGRGVFVQRGLPGAKAVVMGYKYLSFEVAYTPTRTAATAAAEPVVAAGQVAAGVAPADLTPAALIARLQSLTVKKLRDGPGDASKPAADSA